MISCMIVGGDYGRRVGEFIKSNSGGSIEIDESNIFTGFTQDSKILKSSYIKVNKLIYLIDESIDINNDIKVLYELMGNKAFFKVEEIWIFGKDSELNIKSINLFKKIMLDLNFSEYFITLNEDDISFRDLYKEITGITDYENSDVAYKKIYRAKANDESKVGYDPESYKRNIEIVEDDRVAIYEGVKDSAVKAETGKVVRDSTYREISKIDLDIKEVDLDGTEYKQNIFIVSGLSKAGSSAFASSLCSSINEKDISINLVDLSNNCGGARLLVTKSKKYTLVDNIDLLTGNSYSSEKMCIFTTNEITRLSSKPDYLLYYFSIPNRVESDYIVIDCDIVNLEKVIDLCKTRVKSVFICCQDTKDEIYLTKGYIDSLYSRKVNTILYLNNSFSYVEQDKKMSSVECKEFIPNIKIISPTNLNTADLSLVMDI